MVFNYSMANERDYYQKVYSVYYLNNLKVLLNHLSFQWLHPDEIKENPNTIPWEWDPYLKENMDKKINLALSILKIGSYWPLVVTDGYYISEGCHRVQSMKLAVKEGLWPKERRILSLFYPDKFSLKRKNWQNLPVDELNIFSIPGETMFLTREMNAIDYLHPELTGDKIVEEGRASVFGIQADNYFKMMDIYAVLPIFLRYGFFNAEKSGDPILPLSKINNEDDFFGWYMG